MLQIDQHLLTTAGAIVVPTVPDLYRNLIPLEDPVNSIIAPILDQIGFENRLIQRWKD